MSGLWNKVSVKQAISVMGKHGVVDLMVALEEAEKGRKQYQYICASKRPQHKYLKDRGETSKGNGACGSYQ